MNTSIGRQEPIAIIGMGCRFPGAANPHAFWSLLCEGRFAVREVPPDRWDIDALYHPDPLQAGKMVSRWGGFLDNVDHFDWRTFGILPREAKYMDPQHRLLLEVAWEALEDAGLPFPQIAGSRTGVFIGISWNDYLRLQSRNWSQLDGYTLSGNVPCFAANRISYTFDLKGPSLSLDAGCTSSLMGLYLACQSLRAGETDLALVGGVSLMLSPDSTILVSKAGLLSPEGRCKTLDANADGFVRGEGAGLIVLKSLSRIAPSDRVYAIISGVAVNHNGHNEWIIAANEEAQHTVLREAYDRAGINPAQLDYVELHGTGFARGDPIETKALGMLLNSASRRERPCQVGSVKTNIGHLEAASGVASLIKVALSLSHRQIPPMLHLRTVNPEIPLQDLHLAVPQSLLAWPEKEGTPLAGVTTLAFAGSNAHAILAAAPIADTAIPRAEEDTQQVRLLPLSARTEQALYAHAAAVRNFLLSDEATLDASWHDICYTAGVRRTHHAWRIAVTGCTRMEAAAALDALLHIPGSSLCKEGTSRSGHAQEKLVFLFPHRSIARTTAGKICHLQQPAYVAMLEACAQAYVQLTGTPLFEASQGSRTPFTFASDVSEPVVHFILLVALAALWRSLGIVPDAVLGEGSGEVAAACAAGVLSMKEGLLVCDTRSNSLAEQSQEARNSIEIDTGTCPIYSSVMGNISSGQSLQTTHWTTPPVRPDLLVPAIDEVIDDGFTVFIELGPSSALSGAVLARLHHRNLTGTVLPSFAHDTDEETALLQSLGVLYTSGYTIDWATLSAEKGHCVSLPLYSWQRERLGLDWLDVREISTPPESRFPEAQIGIAIEQVQIPDGRSVEESLLALWKEVLGLKQVNMLDNFFELGGHSLLAGQLLARIQAAFHLTISLSDLFRSPTPASCAALITQMLATETPHELAESSLVTPDREQRFLPFPLTDVQQAYWIGRNTVFELGNVGNHAYVEVEAYEFDVERFSSIIQRLIERHEMLHAILLPDGQQQILEQIPPYHIKVEDLRKKEPQAVATRLEEIRRELDHQVFSVEQWPSFEIRVSLLAEKRSRLHLSIESLFIDAWSMHLLVQECIQLYHKPEMVLSPPELSFRDYVLATAALQESKVQQNARAYWLKRIPSLPLVPDLPLAHTPASITHPRFVHREGQLHATAWSRLKARAAQAWLTPSCVLLAAFAEVLAHWCKTPRFSINLTVFNRLPLHPQVQSIVGDFTSLTLLAVDHSEPDIFENRARRLQEQLWTDLDHSAFSGVRVLRELARHHGQRVKALIPVVFTSLLIQDMASPLPAPWQETIYCVTQTPQVWLDHQVLEEGGKLIFHWQAVEALFPDGLLNALFESYCLFLERLATEEDLWSSLHLNLVPPHQLQVQEDVNATEAPISNALLQDLFLEQVRKGPHQAAVISPRRTLTYQEIYNGALLLGYHLRQAGAHPNQLIAVVMEKGWEQVVAALGILLAGAAYLPIEAELPPERLTYLLEHGEVQLAVTQPWLEKALAWPAHIHRFCIDDSSLQDEGMPPLEVLQGPEDLAYVIYTSGSTGLPKGVVIDHRGAVNTILDINQRFHVSNSDRVLALSSLSFDLSVYDIFGILGAGGAIVMPGPTEMRNPDVLLDLLIQHQVTMWNSVPALLQMFVEYTEVYSASMRDACLRLALLSGDWIPLSLPDRLKKLVAGVEVISLGGATEASIWSIFYPIDHIDPSWTSIPYGRPLLNQRFRVLNDELEPCPTWVPGQLFIAGLGLAKGYWHDEDRTRASFFSHPRTGERLYRTGDLGRFLPDGTIEFLGREDLQVKVQGYRIELGEIEAVLIHHPEVQEAIVAVIGERYEDKRLVAYVVPKQGQQPTRSALRAFLRERLPAYMVPSLLMLLDSLPLTANGKVNRKALPRPVELFEETEEAAASSPAPAADAALLSQMVQLVAGVLRVSTLSPEMNLLECGATSLSIVRIINRIETVFRFRPGLEEFFLCPTVRWLATAYEQHLRQQEEGTGEVGVVRGTYTAFLSKPLVEEREEGRL